MEKGTIIKVDYDAYIIEGHRSGRDEMTKQSEVIEVDGELFDTTSAETARKHEKYQEDAWYGALPLVVGAGRVVPGFDKALLDAKVGIKAEVTIPAPEAYGERDPAKFETMSLREFQKREVEPHPGARISIGQRTATVMSVTAGRVRLDFNPPLAGKALKYVFTVVEEVSDPSAQILTIIDMDYAHGKTEGFQARIEHEVATITLPDACKYDQRWFVAKYVVVSDIKNFTKVRTIRFVEEYTTPLPASPAKAPLPVASEDGAGDAKPAAKKATHAHAGH